MVKGWHKFSLVDYPGHICTTIFLGGCNFKCFYCHNRQIAFTPEEVADIDIENITGYLEKRKGYIEGVCISGGEPTIHGPEMVSLLKHIKSLGFKVKLDTNGTSPGILKKVIEGKLVDYIAMDVKAPRRKYHIVTGLNREYLSMDTINESIHLIKKGEVEYEFRTTVIPGIHDKQDIYEIGLWLAGAFRYVLQPCRGEYGNTSSGILREYARITSRYFSETLVR